jgi:pimeloyl-ACP methyl ester carboxylesterase
MFSETRYALNGDLRIAYRATREGQLDLVFVSNWFTSCEVAPELPSIQGWVEAMTSLGRLIFFDQPGTGASDPVTPGALPTLEQWADSITAVLDALGSREAVLIAAPGALGTAALFAATHPSRTAALIVLECAADPGDRTELVGDELVSAIVAMWGTGEFQHLLNPDMPWNEEVRAALARQERLAASPRTVALMFPLVSELNVHEILPTVRVPTLVVQHADDPFITPAMGKDVADHIPDAKYVELQGRNLYHFVEPWRDSFQEIAEFLTGHQAEVPDDRVLATVLFTDIVDSTRRAAEMGDRDWRALLDAHDAVGRAQLARFRGPRGEHVRRRFPRDVRQPAASDPLRDGDPRRGAVARHRGARRVAHRRVRGPRRGHRRYRRAHRRAGERTGGGERRAGVQHAARPRDRLRTRVRGARRSPAQGRARRVAAVRRRFSVAVGFGETHFACRNKRLCTRC